LELQNRERERRVRKEHISIIAELLQADHEDLHTLWLADQVTVIVDEQKQDIKKSIVR
jgi:hypothetical protein